MSKRKSRLGKFWKSVQQKHRLPYETQRMLELVHDVLSYQRAGFLTKSDANKRIAGHVRRFEHMTGRKAREALGFDVK